MMCWRAVRNVHNDSDCWTTAACFLYTGSVNGCPLSVTVPNGLPPLGSSVSVFNNVVFPAPEGPMIASTSPGRTVAEQPSISIFSFGASSSFFARALFFTV
eukprot:3765127-Prymnesium_polylepis.1